MLRFWPARKSKTKSITPDNIIQIGRCLMSNGRSRDISMTGSSYLTEPWWMVRIKDFYALRIHPSQVMGRGHRGEVLTWPCAPESATCWIVYGLCKLHGTEGGYESFASFSTEADAQVFYDRLLALFPHLRGKTAAWRQSDIS